MKYRAILIVAVVTLASLAILLTARKSSPSVQFSEGQQKQLESDLDLLIESYKVGKVDVIDISTITPFAWEKLYLFGPYSSKKEIAKITGIKRLGNLRSMIETNDGIVLFVFVDQNKIVQYMDYHRNPDFAESVRDSGYGPSEAIFVLDETGRAVPKSP
jgi:hypothetical protein